MELERKEERCAHRESVPTVVLEDQFFVLKAALVNDHLLVNQTIDEIQDNMDPKSNTECQDVEEGRLSVVEIEEATPG